jgi:hypothetical protein
MKPLVAGGEGGVVGGEGGVVGGDRGGSGVAGPAGGDAGVDRSGAGPVLSRQPRQSANREPTMSQLRRAGDMFTSRVGRGWPMQTSSGMREH